MAHLKVTMETYTDGLSSLSFIIFAMVRLLFILRAEMATRDHGTPCPTDAHFASTTWNFPSEAERGAQDSVLEAADSLVHEPASVSVSREELFTGSLHPVEPMLAWSHLTLRS